MSKKCGRCEKTVYPTEELNCLDKAWHKACFKCKECNMTLNMKNYKGYNKEPYCNAHYPTTKFTSVADTPEARRLSSNTRIQSQVQYHAEFEKERGKIGSTIGMDDPNVRRALEQQRNISQIQYQDEFRKNKGQVVTVVDDPSIRRAATVQQQISQVQYHADFEKQKGRMIAVAEDPEMLRHKTNTAITSNVAYHGVLEQRDNQEKRRPSQIQEDTSTAVQQSQPSPTVSPPSAQELPNQPQSFHQHSDIASSKVGSIADYDPLNDQWGSMTQGYTPASAGTNPYEIQTRTGSAGGMQANGSVAAQGPPSLPRPEGRVYKAIYDYQAQDDDEIGFEEGDLIINCEPIDEGWMQGMHKKSGQVGMLPANYVELVL